MAREGVLLERAYVQQAICMAEFRYTDWIHQATNSLLDRKLYDHRHNNREEINVINDPAVAGFLP